MLAAFLPLPLTSTLQVLDDMATMAYDKVVLGMGNEVSSVLHEEPPFRVHRNIDAGVCMLRATTVEH